MSITVDEERRLKALRYQPQSPEAQLKFELARQALYKALDARITLTDEQIAAGNESLMAFFELGWGAMEAEPLQRNWHQDLICEYIEALVLGQMQTVVINIQPRCLKSLLCSVFAPAWIWLKYPYESFLCLSFATSLANTLSIKRRNLIQSNFYRQMQIGGKFGLIQGENRMSEFTNTKKGQMFARGLDSGVTGVGAKWLVVDDPNDPEKMESTVIRERNNMRARAYITNRVNNPKKVRRLIIQQRTHDLDFTGMIKEEFGDKAHYLIIPTICEKRTIINFPVSKQRFKRSPGRLLHSSWFGPEQVKEAQWNKRAFQCLYQQAPIPPGGGIIKSKHFNRYKAFPAYPRFWIVSWDTAQEKDETSAYWCGICAAIHKGRIYIKDVHLEQHEYPDGERMVISTAKKWGLTDKPHQMLIEKKSTGATLIQRLRTERDFIPLRLCVSGVVPPPSEDKIARMCSEAPMIEAGYVYLPESAEWLPDFERSLIKFPDGLMDPVDAMSQLLKWFRTSGWRTD